MIIARSPLRLSLGGGGTDLPSYYQEHGGFLMAAAINKYVYITLNRSFINELTLKYSSYEQVKSIKEIQHPIIREVFNHLAIDPRNIEISCMADIPAGTGLGSSGSFTTALLKALHTFNNNLIHPKELAEEACHIELDLLKEPIGKQDQYIAAYGGITCFDFLSNGQVEAHALHLDPDVLVQLEENLLLFFTGYSREASAILREQDNKSKEKDKGMIDNLHAIKEMGYQSQAALQKGDFHTFAALMNQHWQQKKQRSAQISNSHIDTVMDLALKKGALGGKVLGAGGGGFLMFYTEDKMRLRQAMREVGLEEVHFQFDFSGTKVIIPS